MIEKEAYGRAADLIAEHGLARRAYRGDGGCYCALGAMAVASGLAVPGNADSGLVWIDRRSFDFVGPISDEIADALGVTHGEGYGWGAVSSWSDGSSADEVVVRLRLAAAS